MEPPFEAKPLSADVAKHLELAQQQYNLIVAFHSSALYKADLRHLAFHALSDQVHEHFGAILHLVQLRQFFGSAFALLRPLIESALRAVWVEAVASEEDIGAIGRRDPKAFPSFWKCQAAVTNFYERSGTEGLYVMSAEFVTALHGYTHSGLEQIENRIDASFHITPYNYSDANIKALLANASGFAIMAKVIQLQSLEGSPEKTAQKAEELQRRCSELSKRVEG